MTAITYVDPSLAALVTLRHDQAIQRGLAERCAAPRLVSKLACELAAKVYWKDYRPETAEYLQRTAVAGHLVYAIQLYAETFTSLCEQYSCPDVIALVAEITPDSRLGWSHSHADLKARLYQASPLAQIVKLAEIAMSIRDAVSHAQELAYDDAAPLKRWAMERVELVEALESGDLRLPLSGVFAMAKRNLRGLIETAEGIRNPRPSMLVPILLAFEDDEDDYNEVEDVEDDDVEDDEVEEVEEDDWADDDEEVDADEMIFHRGFFDAVMKS